MKKVSDMTKTKWLRFFLSLPIFATIIVAVVIADVTLEMVTGYTYRVEGFVFWWVVCGRVYRWLDRRVWIGTQASMLP